MVMMMMRRRRMMIIMMMMMMMTIFVEIIPGTQGPLCSNACPDDTCILLLFFTNQSHLHFSWRFVSKVLINWPLVSVVAAVVVGMTVVPFPATPLSGLITNFKDQCLLGWWYVSLDLIGDTNSLDPTVRNMRGLQYIGAGLQYIGAPKFHFQDSGKEWRGRVLIKPGFVYHMMV